MFGTSRHRHAGFPGVAALELDVRSDKSEGDVSPGLQPPQPIDVLVNNVGVMLEGFAEKTGPAEARAILKTDLVGAVGMVNMR